MFESPYSLHFRNNGPIREIVRAAADLREAGRSGELADQRCMCALGFGVPIYAARPCQFCLEFALLRQFFAARVPKKICDSDRPGVANMPCSAMRLTTSGSRDRHNVSIPVRSAFWPHVVKFQPKRFRKRRSSCRSSGRLFAGFCRQPDTKICAYDIA